MKPRTSLIGFLIRTIMTATISSLILWIFIWHPRTLSDSKQKINFESHYRL